MGVKNTPFYTLDQGFAPCHTSDRKYVGVVTTKLACRGVERDERNPRKTPWDEHRPIAFDLLLVRRREGQAANRGGPVSFIDGVPIGCLTLSETFAASVWGVGKRFSSPHP